MPRLLFLLPLLLVADLRGQQPPQNGPEHPAAKQLRSAGEKLKAEQYIDGIEICQRLIDTAGDEVVPDPLSPRTLVPVRWLVHREMAQLPAAGLRVYRSRVDSAMQARLARADTHKSVREYRSILEDAFCSRPAAEAIRRLGEQHLERGEISRASHYLSLFDQPHAPDRLNYPDAGNSPAATLARRVVLDLMAGNPSRAAASRDRLRKEHPAAKGILGGRDVVLADAVDALWSKRADLRLPPSRGEWPSFAGEPDRAGRIDSGLPERWPTTASWTFAVPSENTRDRQALNRSPTHPRSLVFQPTIHERVVYFADACRVFALRLDDGSLMGVYDLRSSQIGLRPDLKLPSARDSRPTLTVAGDRLLVRLGCLAMRSPGEGETSADSYSALVSLPLLKDATAKWLPDWILTPKSGPDELVILEGAPVAAEGLLFSLEWHYRGVEAEHHLVAYRPASPAPVRAWSVPLGRILSESPADTRYRQELLSASGHQVLYSGGGRVVSIDASTGKRQWSVSYTQKKVNHGDAPPAIRDLCPPIWAEGKVFAAPNDSDRVICIDAFDGRLLWEVQGVEVTHMLGVSQNKLIVCSGGDIRGVRAFNIDNGGDRPDAGGWAVVDDGGLTSFGRGLLTDEVVVWPTRQGLYFLAVEDGSAVRQPIPGPLGHLAFGDGVIVATTATEVKAWVPASRAPVTPAKPPEFGRADPQRLFDLAENRIRQGDTAGGLELLRQVRSRTDSKEWKLRAGLREIVLSDGIAMPTFLGENVGGVFLAGENGVAVPASRLIEAEARRLGWANAVLGGPVRLQVSDAERVALAAGYEAKGFGDASRVTWPRAGRYQSIGTIPEWIAAADADTSARLLSLPPLHAAKTPTPLPADVVEGAFPLLPLGGSIGLPLCLAGPLKDGWGVRRVDPVTRKPLWQVVVHFCPDRVLAWGDGVILTGIYGFARIKADAVYWEYVSVVDEPVRPTRSTLRIRGDEPDIPKLEHYRIEGGRIFCIRDATTLMAFDPETGEADWVRQFGNPSLPGVGAIDPAYRADGERLLLHHSSGKVLLLDSATGKTMQEYPGRAEVWVSPPLVDRNHRFLFADGHEYLCATPVRSSSTLKPTPIPLPVSLTGENTRLIAVAGRFVAVLSRDFGLELRAIEIADELRSTASVRVSPNSLVLPCPGTSAPEVDFDATRLYIRQGDLLRAIDPLTLSLDWELRLPGGRTDWKMLVGRDGLLLIPDRVLPTSLGGLTIESAISRALRAWQSDSSLVYRIDSETGKVAAPTRIPDTGLIRRVMPIQNGWIVAGYSSCTAFAP